jgi:hypothetical protein
MYKTYIKKQTAQLDATKNYAHKLYSNFRKQITKKSPQLDQQISS